ncbi:hypothetical protein PCE1_001931 [Barthelona sp. PCE]
MATLSLDIVREYTRLRKSFGRPTAQFEAMSASLLDIPPEPQKQEQFMQKVRRSIGVSCIADYSVHEINTERHEVMHTGMQHIEGGWPKTIDPTSAENTSSYRKKVEKDEKFINAVVKLSGKAMEPFNQNQTFDIYEDYFVEEAADEAASEPPSARSLVLLHDPHGAGRRTAYDISFYPDDGSKLAVAYSESTFQPSLEDTSCASYIWDLNSPNAPLMTLTPPWPVVSLQYNPRDMHLLAGGCQNGLITVWDVRKSGSVLDSSAIEHSHEDPVFALRWLQSKSACELLSVSTDGKALFWDIRKLSEPTESLSLQAHGQGMLHGGVCLNYDISAGPNKFLIGTEQGSILPGNRKVKSVTDRIGTAYDNAHLGPVLSISRNPAFPRYFLSVGDWVAKVWYEEEALRSPIVTTHYHSSYLTSGQWSPTRPSCFLTTRLDGHLDVWDVLHKQTGPVISLHLSNAGLHKVEIENAGQGRGQRAAVGVKNGDVHIVHMSNSLVHSSSSEKTILQSLFERETRREKENRNRAQRLKEQRDQAEETLLGYELDDKTQQSILFKVQKSFQAMLGR